LRPGGGSSSQSGELPPPSSPSFRIVATTSAPSIAPGTSSSFQVSITAENGFGGTVAVSVAGLPAGLTAAPSSFSPQNTSQTITLTAASILADGNYSFSLNGTSGTLNASATVNVGVENLAGFGIVATPSALSIAPGTSSTFQVSITPENGFSGTVAVSISRLPSGLTAAPSSLSLQNTSQTVTLTAAGTLADGNYSFSLSGTSGTLNASATVNLGVENLEGFLIVQPLISQIVARFGSTAQMQLETEQTGLGISNYLLTFSVTGLPSGVSASFSRNPVPVVSGKSIVQSWGVLKWSVQSDR
jgi:uncharacterized protein with FMN-binding domain